MNKKGITTVELLVSFLLTSIVVLFIFEMIFTLKELYVSYGIKTELLTKQAIMSEKINNELYNKEISSAEKCGEYCIHFSFSDGTSSNLEFNRDEKIFKYGNYTTKLITGSQYGNIEISTETVVGVDPFKNNSIVKITMPIIHPLLKKQNFGINIIYQYNNQNASLSNVFVADYLDVEKKIYLMGSANDVAFANISYEDPGFYTITSEGVTTENDIDVIVSGTVGTKLNQTYQIKYIVLDSNDIVISTRVRNVTLVNSVNMFSYTGKVQNFVAPVSGEYKVELWGAQGGTVGDNSEGGNGGYTVGNIELSKGEEFSIYVGGQGKYTPYLIANGGYNGGGKSGAGSTAAGASGGGATDIRIEGTTLNDRYMVAGGGGGASSNLDDYTTGGVGGGLIGKIGTYPTVSYNGSPGTDTSGGLAATYTDNVTLLPTNGTLGIGGNGGTYSSTNVYGGGGGGGGYYGGGGGVRYGTGAGGSGYCNPTIMSCLTNDGDSTFPSPTDLIDETGHSGNGYVRITLISVTNG